MRTNKTVEADPVQPVVEVEALRVEAPQSPVGVIEAGAAAARQLSETERNLRARHVALSKEKTKTSEARRSLDECVADVPRLVDEQLARIVAEYGGLVADAISGASVTDVTGRKVVRRPPAVPCLNINPFALLVALDPALAKVGLVALLKATPGARFGLPAAERAATLGGLDTQIRETEEAHTRLCDSAAEAGLDLPLLPVVRARREAEERRLARAEREKAEAKRVAAEEREARGVSVQMHSSPAGLGMRVVDLDGRQAVTRSSYIESQR